MSRNFHHSARFTKPMYSRSTMAYSDESSALPDQIAFLEEAICHLENADVITFAVGYTMFNKLCYRIICSDIVNKWKFFNYFN